MNFFLNHTREGHPLVRLDIRTRLIITLAVLIMVVSDGGIGLPLLIFVLCILASRWLEVPWRTILLRLVQPLFLTAVIVIVKFFLSGDEPLFTFAIAGVGLTGYADGLREGLLLAVRILAAVSLVALVGFTTTLPELMAALAWFRVPQGLVEVMILTCRYLFVLWEGAQVVYHSQRNRLGYSSFRSSLRSIGVLAGSLLIKTFDQSQNLTIAMQQRGYDGQIPLFRQKPLRKTEMITAGVIIGFLGLMWQLY